MKRRCNPPDDAVVPNEVAGLDQQVEEIEAACPSLQFRIGIDRGLQRLLKKRRQVRITSRYERVELLLDLVPLDQHLVAGEDAVPSALSALPTPAACTSQVTEQSFEPVIIPAAHCFGALVLLDEARDLGQVPAEVVVRPRALPARAQADQLLDNCIDRRAGRTGRDAIGSGNRGALEGCPAHSATRLAVAASRPAPKQAPNALGRIGERRLEPASNAWIGKRRLRPRPLPRTAIYARLTGRSRREIAAETVNRAHAGKFEFASA